MNDAISTAPVVTPPAGTPPVAPSPPAPTSAPAKAPEKPVEKPADASDRTLVQAMVHGVYGYPGSGLGKTHTAVSGGIEMARFTKAGSNLDAWLLANVTLYIPSREDTPGVKTFVAPEIQLLGRWRWATFLKKGDILTPFAALGLSALFGDGPGSNQDISLNGAVSGEAGVEFFAFGGKKKDSPRVALPVISGKTVQGILDTKMRFYQFGAGLRVDW